MTYQQLGAIDDIVYSILAKGFTILSTKIRQIQQSAYARYQLVLNDNEASQIAISIKNDFDLQMIKLKISQLLASVKTTTIYSAGMLSIMLGLITILLIVTNNTDQFMSFFWSTIKGLVIGQTVIYSYFYIRYKIQYSKASKKIMFLKLAHFNHNLAR